MIGKKNEYWNIRIGLPMNFIILAANIFIVNLVSPLTPLK